MARKPRDEAAAAVLTVRISPAERARIAEALRVNRQNLSDFARDALMGAAEDCLEVLNRKTESKASPTL